MSRLFRIVSSFAESNASNLNGRTSTLAEVVLLANAGNVNTLGESLHTTKKNAEALVVASKETGLEMNADKTKYMVMPRDQNAGRSRSIKVDKSSFGRVEQFKYLGTTLTNQILLRKKLRAD